MAVFAAVGGGEATPKKEKKRIQVSIDMEELYRLCKMAIMVLTLASLFALILYFYPSLSSPAHPSLSGILAFLLINAVVVSLAMSSGILKSSNLEEKTDSSLNILGEKIPSPALLLSPQVLDSPHLFNTEAAENLHQNRNLLRVSGSFWKPPQLYQEEESVDSRSCQKLPQPEQELDGTQNRNLVAESGNLRKLPQMRKGEEEYTQNWKSLEASTGLPAQLEQQLENVTESEEDEVDRKAEDFIGKFYQQLKMQRLESQRQRKYESGHIRPSSSSS